jgi:hypothetical protein
MNPTHVLTLGISLFVLASGSAPLGAQEDHSAHTAGGYQGHDMPMPPADDQGRRRMGMDMRDMLSDDVITGLKAKIALYRALTDNELRLNVAQMGENYSWYVSGADVKGDIGVLILSHGVSERGDRLVTDSVKSLAAEYPTVIGYGMAMMTSSHLQAAFDDLEAAGAETIVLVQTTSTVYNSMTRQWEYILGQRDESSYLSVKPVKTKARLVFAPNMDDDPLIGDILTDYANEISADPANEVVFLIAHGPEDDFDNVLDLPVIESLASQIKDAGGFSDVKAINLQDDAIPPVREGNVRKLRRWMQQAQRSGKSLIVISPSVSADGLQHHITQDLRGLDYKFNEKGMSQHPNFTTWVVETVRRQAASL